MKSYNYFHYVLEGLLAVHGFACQVKPIHINHKAIMN